MEIAQDYARSLHSFEREINSRTQQDESLPAEYQYTSLPIDGQRDLIHQVEAVLGTSDQYRSIWKPKDLRKSNARSSIGTHKQKMISDAARVPTL